ncbi:hypothetical protein H6G41_25790 [Tolypothrix sp. FACHB-123]|uniref:hypothetical protein n=1 Tax=Tolypothrix sp. FACHB-123 TaxID=2692868 RepID=UPI00168859E9|nr:hypothetical protein [Tolypothrix sp. FACHB-123]MBD2357981.1 hypothetical protein [Tolypothrix sp. FACHB-123]
MANITIQNLDAQNLAIVELDNNQLNEVKGGCPICIPLLFAAGIAAGYLLNR